MRAHNDAAASRASGDIFIALYVKFFFISIYYYFYLHVLLLTFFCVFVLA